jgi:hypothetical protein
MTSSHFWLILSSIALELMEAGPRMNESHDSTQMMANMAMIESHL